MALQPLDERTPVGGLQAHRVVGVVQQVLAGFIGAIEITGTEVAGGLEDSDAFDRVVVDELVQRSGASEAATDDGNVGWGLVGSGHVSGFV